MVNNQEGQSFVEFLLILTALTVLGMIIAFKMWPSQQGGQGAIVNVQVNAAEKIGKD